jgi:hypothetical protein
MSGEIVVKGGLDTRATTYGFARDMETVKATLDGRVVVSGGSLRVSGGCDCR